MRSEEGLGDSPSAAAPSGQYLPGSQSSHAVAPTALWNVPPSHGVHAALLSPAANVPAAHGSLPLADVAPVVQK